MDSRCKLFVETDRPTSREALHLYTSDELYDLQDEDILAIPEYRSFTLTLECQDTDQAYFCIPEMDDYDIDDRINNEELSENLVYKPNKEYNMFGFSTSRSSNMRISEKIQTVPLTPGYYTVEVFSNDDVFYAYWRVITKDLNQEEWRSIRDDVESRVQGLAMDYTTYKRTQVRRLSHGAYKLYLDDDTSYLLNQNSKIRYAVEKLRNEAKFRINKTYNWVPAGSKNEIDQITMRKVGERPDKREQLYSPKRYFEYNITVNKWLKMMLVTVENAADDQTSYLAGILDKLKSQHDDNQPFEKYHTLSERTFSDNTYKSTRNDLTLYTEQLKKLSSYLRNILNEDFLKDVHLPDNRNFPKVLMLNPLYNTLYKIYAGLKHKEKHFVQDSYYNRYWKQTARLYEIWTYIKVLDVLIKLGFNPESGWIYDSEDTLPFLDDGTRVVLRGPKLSLGLVFNQAIPHHESEVSREIPLYIYARKNKPDIRIDIFTEDSDEYLGSIILDAKYKRLTTLLRERNENGYAGVAEQFRAYRNDPDSSLMNIPSEIKPKPVESVVVLYPNDNSNNPNVLEKENSVIYLQLKPGVGDDALRNELDKHLKMVSNRTVLYPVKLTH